MLIALFLALTIETHQNISIDEFVEKYKVAMSRLAERYAHMRVIETKTWTASNKIKKSEGVVCGQFMMADTEMNDGLYKFRTFVSKSEMVTLRKNPKTEEWMLLDHKTVLPGEEIQLYEPCPRQRAMLAGQLPDAFFLPFSESNGRGRFVDTLEKLRNHDKEYILDSIELLSTETNNVYRLCYHICGNDGNTIAICSFQLSPSMDMVITSAWHRFAAFPMGTEWKLEYSKTTDGIPVLRKGIYHTAVKRDKGTDPSIISEYDKPIIIDVDKVDMCDIVNEAEYDPEYYKITLPVYFDPNHPPEMPLAMYIAIGGMSCFIVGILILHYSRRHAGRIPRVDQ